MEQVAVTRLGKGLLRMSISIIVIMSEEDIKIYSKYGAFGDFHRSVISVLVSGVLVKSPIVCNVANDEFSVRL